MSARRARIIRRLVNSRTPRFIFRATEPISQQERDDFLREWEVARNRPLTILPNWAVPVEPLGRSWWQRLARGGGTR